MLDKIIKELKYWKEASNSTKPYNDRERELYYKKCYELCCAIDWKITELQDLEPKTNVQSKTIMLHGKAYATEYLKLEEAKIKSVIYNPKNNLKEYTKDNFDTILIELMKTPFHNKNGIMNIIEKAQKEYHISPIKLRSRIPVFAHDYYAEAEQKMLLSLEEKVDLYFQTSEEISKVNKKERTKKLKQKEIDLTAINFYIGWFIKSEFTRIEDFCECNRIDIEFFQRLLIDCKSKNQELYNILLNSLITKRNFYKLDAIYIANQVACAIKNGIKETNGQTRNFDSIDYCQTIGIDVKAFAQLISENLDTEKIKVIRIFLKQVGAGDMVQNKPQEIEKIRTGKIKISYKIKNTETGVDEVYSPTSEETNLIINYLENNNIPLNEINYSSALKRYLYNNLTFNNKNGYTRRLKVN